MNISSEDGARLVELADELVQDALVDAVDIGVCTRLENLISRLKREAKQDKQPRDSEHADYPVRDWQHEVSNGDTVLGYAEWVSHRLEADCAPEEDGR